MNILWHLRPQFDSSDLNGANLRFFNITHEMVAHGHKVYFLLDDYAADDEGLRESFIVRISRDWPISGLFHLHYHPPRLRHALANKLMYPGLINRVMRKSQFALAAQVRQILTACDAEIYISSVRAGLWLLSDLRPQVITVADWCDSYTLAGFRELKCRLRSLEFARAGASLKLLTLSIAQESYYGRLADVNLFVSPADMKCFDRLAGAFGKTHVIYNGVEMAEPTIAKHPKRLIFSGRMDFPPNYHSALWFIDHVVPLIVAKEPSIEVVIAGASPIPQLTSRNSSHVHITGFVQDLRSEIAASQLYVAPMIAGSGFKNKVVEAIASGTYVVGTGMAFEFLGREIRDLLLRGDSPGELARQILLFLADPSRFDSRLEQARQLVARQFQWRSQTTALLNVFRAALDRARDGLPTRPAL